jgi:hypothetical protein
MKRPEKVFGSLLKHIDSSITEMVALTFDLSSDKLPSREVLMPHLRDPYSEVSLNAIKDILSDENKWMTPYAIREMYLDHAFVAYNDELLTALKKFCDRKKMKIVHEVCCGTGWFSHWMRKYGIPLDKAIDNKTWATYKMDNSFLPIVTQDDAVRFVKRSGDADMFVLSWPYMNPLAHMIWKAMKPGQYLLYIGEGKGGCTADSGFFHATGSYQITDDKDFNKVTNAFIRFRGLHDRPELYLKT